MSTKNFSQTFTDEFEPVIFVHLAFDSGASRIHSGVGKLTWGGNDWFGLGDFGSVKMKEGVDIKPTKATMTLSGVNQEYVNEVLNADSEGRTAEIFFGLIAATGLVSGTPDLLLAGLMGAPTLDMDSGVVSIEVEDFRSRLFLSNKKKFSLEDHQEQTGTSDLFYEWLPKMIDWRFTFNGKNRGGNAIVPVDTSGGDDYFDNDFESDV